MNTMHMLAEPLFAVPVVAAVFAAATVGALALRLHAAARAADRVRAECAEAVARALESDG